MSPLPLFELLHNFVHNATNPGEKSHFDLLLLCDRIIAAYQETPDTFDDSSFPEPPAKDYREVRAIVASNFPDYGFYNIPEKILSSIGDSPIMVGDAIDDITDIVCDFTEFLWRSANTSDLDAIWHFRLGYFSHWGPHMRELQFYLFKREDGE